MLSGHQEGCDESRAYTATAQTLGGCVAAHACADDVHGMTAFEQHGLKDGREGLLGRQPGARRDAVTDHQDQGGRCGACARG